VASEIGSIYDASAGLSFASLREIPLLERFVLEVLRLHPPLVTLMRRVKSDFSVQDQRIPAGDMIAISPYVTHRLPDWYANAFALLQVKSIFCALLRSYDFELVDPPETYRDVMPSLILQVSEPARLRYRRRVA
jgi:sterol 14-demethylase